MRARSPAFRQTAVLSAFEEEKLLFLSCLVECRLQKTRYSCSNLPNTLVVQLRERGWGISQQMNVWWSSMAFTVAVKAVGKFPVWQENGAMQPKRPKSSSGPYFNLPLAFKDLTLLLHFLLWFGFAHSMSFVEWPQPKASFNVCQDNYGKNGEKVSRAQPGGSCSFLGAAQGAKDGEQQSRWFLPQLTGSG